MNKKQVAKLNMSIAVKKLCDKNQDIIDTVPAFADVFLEFSKMLENLISNATETTKKIQGITEEKRFAKTELARQTVSIASVLFVYAIKNSNLILKDAARLSMSLLKKLPDNELPMVCNNFAKVAKENLAEATSFGLTQAKINVLEGMIKDYTVSVPDPRMAISQRKTYNKNVEAAIKQINNILSNQMDRLIINLQEENPDFVSNYFSDRMVINTAIRHRKKTVKTAEDLKIVHVSENQKPNDLSVAI